MAKLTRNASWVFSSQLSSSQLQGHKFYTSNESKTWKETAGASWQIAYADGSGASGTVGTDDVSVGETKVQGQVIELATKVSSSFVQGANDGLLGLSFSSINTGMPPHQSTSNMSLICM